MHKIIDFICDEIDELERKVEKGGKLTSSELEYLDTLAHTKKNLLTADAMMESDDYSNAGASYERDGYGGSYARTRGADGRFKADGRSRRGGYSREGGYSRDGYSRDGMMYSRGADMVDELHDLMDKAPNDQTRKEIERLAMKLEQM